MANRYIDRPPVAPKPEGMEHMTWDEIGEELGLSRQHAWDMAKAGTLPQRMPLTVRQITCLLSYR